VRRRPVPSRRAVGLLSAAAVLTGLVPAAAAVAPPAAPPLGASCTAVSDPAAAAVELYGTGTELVRTEEVSGLRSALVLEPRIAPGTRRRMLAADGGWCDAATGFNAAWDGAGGEQAARAFASVAAAPYFDGVTVTSARAVGGGTYAVGTHALTNGVDATWVVHTDARGVRAATWTATAFAQQPLVGEAEGLTALPGATETYVRAAGDLLAEQRGLPTAESARRASGAPEVAVYTGPDGMKIRISLGDSRVAVHPGTKTGVREADLVQETYDAVKLNYEEFLAWGLKKGWRSDLDPVLGPDVGWVYLNDALSLYCLACVFIADDFQIHMLSEVGRALEALGFTGYGDARKSYTNIVGHEMFHNFQNAANKPGPLGRGAGRGTSTAYSEGTARFQEVLHSYSGVSFAPKTLVTGGQTNPPLLSLDANHCNGYRGTNLEQSLADGPFAAARTYDVCYFWTSWYSQNGLDAFVRLVREGIPAHSPKPSGEEGVRALETSAPQVTVADQLAHFARSALTGRDRVITQASGEPVARDWGTFFFTWQPAELAAGDTSGRLGAAGVLGRRVTGGVRVSLAGTGLALYEVRATAAGATYRALDVAGASIPAPADGERVWVVAVNPTTAAVSATLSASPV
jgi:hypothetical protein